MKLKAAGFRVLIAGGAVRDSLLGRQPTDIDLATDATPNQVAELFEKTILVGKQFGVCRVVLQEQVIEVATFRKDGVYKDGRHPESVEYSNPEEDASRRDFTVNALFMDVVSQEIIDYVDGREDLKKRVIKTVGDPEKRFEEDKLRILRALRFMAQMDFELDLKTEKAIPHFNLKAVSIERIRDEWGKLLLAPKRQVAIEKTKKCKLWRQLFPSWHYSPELYARILGEKNWSLERLWSLWFLKHWGKDHQGLLTQMEDWKLPKEWIKRTVWAAKNWERMADIQSMESVDTALFMSERYCIEGLELYRAMEPPGPAWTEALSKARNFYKEGALPKALVNGDDLIKLGVKPGVGLADQIHRLYRIQLKEGLKSKAEVLSHLD